MIDPNEFAQLSAGAEQYHAQSKPKHGKNKPSGIKGALASLLPTIGGTLGAVGGSFVAPIAGTAAGGAAGSALGEALRQKITGEKTNFGNIGKEAAFGAVPGVFKGAKVGVTAIKGARASKGASAAEGVAQQIVSANKPVARIVDSSKINRDLANEGGRLANPLKDQDVIPTKAVTPTVPDAASVPVDKPTLLSKLSTAATKRGSGIKTDPGVGGIDRADEAARTFQRLGIMGTPTQQLRRVSKVMTSHGKQVDGILAKNPIQLDGAAVRSQVEKAVSDPLKYAELDLSTPGAQKALTAHLDKFAQAKTAKEVNDYVKVLNKVATRAKGKLDRGGTLTDKESAALAAKRAGDDVLTQYPEIAPLKKDMATLFERNGDVTKQSQKTTGVPILGIKSNLVSQGSSGVASKAGQVAAKAGAVAASPGVKNAKKVGGSLLSQLTTRAIAAPLVSTEDQSPNNPTNQSMEAINSATTQMPTSNEIIGPLNPTGDSTASSSFFADPEQVQAAYLQALNKGDSETANAIAKGYELFGQTADTSKGLNSTASGVIADTTTGLNSLAALSDKIAENGANNPIVGQLRSKNPFDTTAQNLQADISTARQIVGKALEGGVLRKEDEVKYAKILPTVGDTDQVAQYKIQQLIGLISGRLSEYKSNLSGGSGGTDLSALGLME
jgi:hypothetical protein